MSIIIEVHGRQIFDSRGNPPLKWMLLLRMELWVAQLSPLELQLESTKL